MKVLFAVSNDNITTSIVGKYQQKYKTIITSKNVYYFNAIIKELQSDKSYDAIVISEDLEPLSNNNYEQIDKIIIDKLDSISDEASKPTGEDIPIIFICSDRRTKSDQLLRKLFSMSIYNALVGNDRSVTDVCNLINKPRSKKEAKKYYQIDEGDQVEYEAGNDEVISEDQIQNIISYYKKIGNNDKKIVEAFDRIAKQYDDTQLRIIIKFIPNYAKGVLEKNSPKYKKLVSNGTVLSNGSYSQYNNSTTSDTELNKLDVFEKDLDKPQLTKPVVIPSTMKNATVKNNNQNGVQNMQNVNNYNQNNMNYNNMNQPFYGGNQMNNQNFGNQGYMNNGMNQNPYSQFGNSPYGNGMQGQQFGNNFNNSPYGNNGYNSNNMNSFNNQNSFGNNSINQQANRNIVNQSNNVSANETANSNVEANNNSVQETVSVTPEPVKRGRGRPRKIRPAGEIDNKPKRGRGRPRKVQPQEAADSINVPTQNVQNTINTNQVNTIKPEPADTVDLFNLGAEPTNNQFNNTQNNVQNTNPQNNNVFNGQNNYSNNNQSSAYSNNNFMNNSIYDDGTSFGNNQQNTYNNFNQGMNTQTSYPGNSFGTDNSINNLIPNLNEESYQSIQNNTTNNTSVGKIAAFVGTTKNGTSFIVNNLAEVLSEGNIKTAILDLTQNKNAYYMFTNSDPNLVKIATDSIKNLERGIAKGVEVNKNLSVFTSVPEEIQVDVVNPDTIINTLSNNFDIVLLDCDFKTESEYFAKANEIYLVQTMDAFTIQPLTKFLSNLKSQNRLNESKIRVIINKYVKLKRLDYKLIIGGMSKYNEPSMTLQRDLFNASNVQSILIPFEEQTYANYLEEIALCQLSTNGYSQNFMRSLNELKNMVYPLIPGGNNGNSNFQQNSNGQQYGNYESQKPKKSFFGVKKSSGQTFSSDVNDTLNKMRKTNY